MKPNKRLMKKIMKRNLALNSCINLTGNKGGDIFQVIDNQDGTIHLRVGSSCVMLIDKIVPVEFLTGIMRNVMLDNNCNIKQIIDTFGWDENFKEELKKKLID
jgi:hypothetical protein